VNTLVAEAGSKLLPQRIVYAVNNKVHDLHRRIDDSQPFDHALEGDAEKLIVKFDDDLLFAFGVVDAACTVLAVIRKRSFSVIGRQGLCGLA
jgi:hypothetical protein